MPKLKLRVAFEAKEQSARVACKAKVHSSAAKGPGWYFLTFLSLELIVESGEGKQRSDPGKSRRLYWNGRRNQSDFHQNNFLHCYLHHKLILMTITIISILIIMMLINISGKSLDYHKFVLRAIFITTLINTSITLIMIITIIILIFRQNAWTTPSLC